MIVNQELSIPLLYEDNNKPKTTSHPAVEGNANTISKTKKTYRLISSNLFIYFAGSYFTISLAFAAIVATALSNVALDQAPLPTNEKFLLHVDSILNTIFTNNFKILLHSHVFVFLSIVALWGRLLVQKEDLSDTSTITTEEGTSPIQPNDSGSITSVNTKIQIYSFLLGSMFGMTLVIEFIYFYVLGKDLFGINLPPPFSFIKSVSVDVAYLAMQFITVNMLLFSSLSEQNNDEDQEDKQI